MIDKATLLKQLEATNIDRRGSLLIHSSMKSLGEIVGGADTVIDAFIEFMQDGLLIMPTHTWDKKNNRDNRFDPESEPSCVGILGELFRQRPGVLRSLHPTHSVAVIGTLAADFIAGEERFDSPCPPQGVWGKLAKYDTQILFLGCPLSKNTFIHSIEEQYQVPQRLSQHFTDYKIKVAGKWLDCPMRGHEAPCADISLNYGKLLPVFLQRGAARKVKISTSTNYLCSAMQMEKICGEYLSANSDFFMLPELN